MKISLHKTILATSLILSITALFFNDLSAQSCTCPPGAIQLTSATSPATIVGGNDYCVSSANSPVVIAGAINIIGSNTTICIEEGAYLRVTGSIFISGTNNIITVSDGSALTIEGAITSQTGVNAIQINDCAVLEVCGTTTLNSQQAFGSSNTIDYIGDGAATGMPDCSSYAIFRGSVAGSEIGSNPNIADELITIFIAAISLTNVQIDCGPNALNAPGAPGPPTACLDNVGNGTWPMGLSNSNVECGEAEDIADDISVDVELLAFSAQREDKMVALHWATASETENLGFEIERSRNAKNWKKIGFVEGNYTTIQHIQYKWMDLSPLNDLIYYRLKQLDVDGKYSYSPIVNVESNKTPQVLVYPTSVKEVLNIDYSEDIDLVKLEIIHLTGKTVWRTESSTPSKIDVHHLEAGMYYILFQTMQGQIHQASFVKH